MLRNKSLRPADSGDVDWTTMDSLLDELQDAVGVYPIMRSINNTLSGCTTSNNATEVVNGSSYSATITADTNYTLTGATVSIRMVGVDITSTAYNNGTINIASVTGNVVITITAVSTICNITNTLVGCSTNNNASTVTRGSSYSATITANNNYTLSGATVSITMNNVDITSSAYSNGSISIASVTGDVSISIVAVSTLSQLVAYATPQTGVTYTNVEDLTNYTDAQIREISNAISNNSSITSSTETVYLSDGTSITVGAGKLYTLSTQEEIIVSILGFNHDTYDTDAATAYNSSVTGKAGITWEMQSCLETKYTMNSSNINYGGWYQSDLRNTTLPTIFNTLPVSLQNIIIPVVKKAADGGSTNYTETLEIVDTLFLLAEIEVFGTASYAQDGANEGTTYKSYSMNTESWYRVKGRGISDEAPATAWYTRSCVSSNTGSFVGISTSGSQSSLKANVTNGISFAYCT